MDYPYFDISRIKWAYLRHPSGRIHTINANESDLINLLLKQGWVKVQQPVFEDKTVIHRQPSRHNR